MVAAMGDEKGDQGGLPGPPHRTSCAAWGSNAPRARLLQPDRQTCSDGERRHPAATSILSRPRGLLGPCAAMSGMHGPEGALVQQCTRATRQDLPAGGKVLAGGCARSPPEQRAAGTPVVPDELFRPLPMPARQVPAVAWPGGFTT